MSRPTDPRYKNRDNDPKGPYVLVDITAPVFRPNLAFTWHGHSPPEGRSWRFTADRLQELERAGAIYFPASGRPTLKRYLADRPIEAAEEPPGLGPVEVLVRRCMKELAEVVAHTPAALDKVEWRDLERILREVFEKLGFDTQLTRSSKDGGFDLRLTARGNGHASIFLIEVKHWVSRSKRPGLPVVRALFDIVASTPNVAAGLLLSSSGYTAGAVHGRTEIQQERVRLGGRDKIVSLCQSYVRVAQGLWTPLIELPDLLLAGTQ